MVQIFGSLENLSLTLILRRDSLVQPLVSLSLSGSPTFPKRTSNLVQCTPNLRDDDDAHGAPHPEEERLELLHIPDRKQPA